MQKQSLLRALMPFDLYKYILEEFFLAIGLAGILLSVHGVSFWLVLIAGLSYMGLVAADFIKKQRR
jgi:hypothetical protein